MISGTDLGTELLDLGKVLGLFGADGNLDPSGLATLSRAFSRSSPIRRNATPSLICLTICSLRFGSTEPRPVRNGIRCSTPILPEGTST